MPVPIDAVTAKAFAADAPAELKAIENIEPDDLILDIGPTSVAYLKIDGDFIRGLATSPTNQLVVSAIVSIARGMGKKTVAEFVADEETARLLRTIGVDCAQGFHIGMPRLASDVLQTTGAGLV